MPEIWLNYGITDVVLDIRAENLDQQLQTQGKTLDDSTILSKLESLDTSKPLEIVVLHNSPVVQQTLGKIFEKCEQKSQPIPRILADKKIIMQVKAGLPEGSQVMEFGAESLSNSSLVFISEVEFDGLFGFETIATRLIKKFGKEEMLSAYEKRSGDLPASGQTVENMQVANKFTDNFEILGIDVAANSKGIVDLSIGHPSKTSVSKSFLESSILETEKHKTLIISTGKETSNDSLGKSLNSLWNCYPVIKNEGLAVLLGECKNGVGSEAIHQVIEGRLNPDKIKKPVQYINGMENLLYLNTIQEKLKIALISILPEFYTKKLNIKSLGGMKLALDYIIRVQGANQKISIVNDGARLLLKEKS